MTQVMQITRRCDVATLESMSQAIWYNRWTLQRFSAYLGADILEVGCGIGNFTQTLIKYGNVVAIDVDEPHIERTSRLVAGKAQIGFGDIERGEYFFSDMAFNAILCLNVLEHIQDDGKALFNLAALLKPGGALILLVPAHSFLFGEIDHAIGHLRRYNKRDLEHRFREMALEIITNREINFLGAVGWWLAGKVFRHDTISTSKIALFNMVAPLFLSIENVLEPPFGTSILVIARKIETAGPKTR